METKFQYDYLNSQLSILKPDTKYIYQIPEEHKFTSNFGGHGFILGESSWITFQIYTKKVQVFAKFSQNSEAIYYRHDFAKADIINFQFTETDQVKKTSKNKKTD